MFRVVIKIAKFHDLTGYMSGRLKVISCTGRDKHGNALWRCICDCGNEVVVKSYNLVTQGSKSCGCLRIENTKLSNTKHGLHGQRIYRIWANMLSRCGNRNKPDYRYYGGRGIIVCEEWRGFSGFAKWSFLNGYNDDLTLDRINVNGNYCPENCRWATWVEQMNNTTRNKKRL